LPGKKRGIPPALALFLLSPAVGELLSGSAPPAEFFTPFGFTIMALLYGGGALVARELKVRWGRGMGSMLLLGAAYGILEEGMMVASFFSPYWPDLGVLGVFGRWMGVNWVWAVELTAYHAFVSITVPVILVELAYPEAKAEPWLRGIWGKLVPLLLAGDVVFGFLLFGTLQSYWPPAPQYLLMAALAVALTALARRLPPDWARRGERPIRGPRYYWLVAALTAFGCGLVFWVLPNLLGFPMAPLLVILAGVLVVWGVVRLITSHDWRQSRPAHRLALAAGALTPLIVSALFQEFDKSRPDDTTGMALVGLASIAGLLLLKRRIDRLEAEERPLT